MTFTDRELSGLRIAFAAMTVLAIIAMTTPRWVSWTAVALAGLVAFGSTLFVALRWARPGGVS